MICTKYSKQYIVGVWCVEGTGTLFNNLCKFDTKLSINLFAKTANCVFGKNTELRFGQVKKVGSNPKGGGNFEFLG